MRSYPKNLATSSARSGSSFRSGRQDGGVTTHLFPLFLKLAPIAFSDFFNFFVAISCFPISDEISEAEIVMLLFFSGVFLD